jgi:hypothetical protein
MPAQSCGAAFNALAYPARAKLQHARDVTARLLDGRG